MIDLTREQRLPLLGVLAIGDVHRHATNADDFSFAIARRRDRAGAPANGAVGTPHAKFRLVRLTCFHRRLKPPLKIVPVVGKNENLQIFRRDCKLPGHHTVNRVLAFVPFDGVGSQIPIP